MESGKVSGESAAAIRRLADCLLLMQTADGALPLAQPGTAGAARVVPYFAHFGAWGLAIAYRISMHAPYLSAVQRWVEWNDARRNPDGTVYDYQGKTEAWISTKDYDSTDSYGSTYLELMGVLEALPLREGERRWLRTRLPFARQALDAMLLTQQKNGLTTAKPSWPVMYTMDNTEVLRGLLAGRRFFQSAAGRDAALAARCQTQAQRVATAIHRDLWDARNGCYLVGLQTDGGRMTGLQKWYPDIMANLMALGWLPVDRDTEARHPALFQRLIRQYADSPGTGLPKALGSEEDMERVIWWGYAAQARRDRMLTARIIGLLRTFDPAVHPFTNPATLGHACRLLAAEP